MLLNSVFRRSNDALEPNGFYQSSSADLLLNGRSCLLKLRRSRPKIRSAVPPLCSVPSFFMAEPLTAEGQTKPFGIS